MNNILVLFTGGTIGSRTSSRTVDVDAAASYELIERYFRLPDKRDVQFETVQPLQLLSENLIPADWLALIATLDAAPLHQYKGVILTHGTDTLPYTAACLSYVFRDSPIPIVLTASNYPLEDVRSEGVRNFAHAIDFILDRALPGVFVVFENDRGEALVHLGTRLLSSMPFTDQFDSTYAVSFGWMEEGRLKLREHKLNPTVEELRATRARAFDRLTLRFSPDILYIRPYPGMTYRYYDFSQKKPKAVLHDLYHSGTACTREDDLGLYSLLHFLALCRSHGVPVYLAPLKTTAGDLYSSSVQLLQAGAVAIENTSVEAALVKLMLAYGMFSEEKEIQAFMQGEPLFFETHQGRLP